MLGKSEVGIAGDGRGTEGEVTLTRDHNVEGAGERTRGKQGKNSKIPSSTFRQPDF
jgi:hypothetical protein